MKPEDIFGMMKVRDVALAMSSANRILIELLIEAGVSRETIERAFRAKASELLLEQHEDGASQLLKMMSGTVRPRTQGD